MLKMAGRKFVVQTSLNCDYILITSLDSESLFVYYVLPLLGVERLRIGRQVSQNNPLKQKARAFFCYFYRRMASDLMPRPPKTEVTNA